MKNVVNYGLSWSAYSIHTYSIHHHVHKDIVLPPHTNTPCTTAPGTTGFGTYTFFSGDKMCNPNFFLNSQIYFFLHDYFGDQSTCLSEEIKHLFPSSYILGELSIFSARKIAQGVAWHYFLTRA